MLLQASGQNKHEVLTSDIDNNAAAFNNYQHNWKSPK